MLASRALPGGRRDAQNVITFSLTGPKLVVRMATSRLYYTDPARLTFEARVLRSEAAPPSHPGAFAVWLSESAFYPTTGGQPFDTGRLGDARVVDVIEDPDGEVVHVIDRPLEPGATVAGAVDAARRLDHRQ